MDRGERWDRAFHNGSSTPRRLATLRSTCPASAVVVPSACVRPGGPLTTTTPVLPWTGGTMTTTVQPLTATSNGLGTTLLPIPASPLLVGAVLRQQAVELVVGTSSLTGVYASNALTLTVGAYNQARSGTTQPLDQRQQTAARPPSQGAAPPGRRRAGRQGS